MLTLFVSATSVHANIPDEAGLPPWPVMRERLLQTAVNPANIANLYHERKGE
jgi:hypothetical protein